MEIFRWKLTDTFNVPLFMLCICTTWSLTPGSLGTRLPLHLLISSKCWNSFRKKRLKIMAESFDFTEEEIRRKLEQLGYSNIPSDKLKLFQRGLLLLLCNARALIYFDRSMQFWILWWPFVSYLSYTVWCTVCMLQNKLNFDMSNLYF